LCETIRPEFYDAPAFRALGWLKRWGIRHFFKIVLIGSIPHIHLGFEGVAAFLTILPVSSVPFVVVVGTERISTVVSVAAITRVRKQDVLVLVIADPVPATVGLDQLYGLAAQPTTRLLHRVCRFAFRHLLIAFPSNAAARREPDFSAIRCTALKKTIWGQVLDFDVSIFAPLLINLLTVE
jgi:hypothetical protein